jgi:hypothetical protein
MNPKTVRLDFRGARQKRKLLANLSGVAVAGRFLWTASDETRTVECLEEAGSSYRLRRQYNLDDFFPALPGRQDDDEADIEALDISDDRL